MTEIEQFCILQPEAADFLIKSLTEATKRKRLLSQFTCSLRQTDKTKTAKQRRLYLIHTKE